MKSVKALREIALFVIGLGIVGLVTAVIIATLRQGVSGKAPIATTLNPTTPVGEPTTAVPYPYPPENRLTPSAAAAETALGLLSTKANLIETYLATTPSPTPQITPLPTGTRESDVYLRSSGRKLGVDTQNAWVGLVDGNEVDVIAGALPSDPEQGIIRIIVSVFRGGISEIIPTPTRHGGVRVVSEHNNRLTLVSTDGTTYYFDVPARRFVDSLTEVVPSATLPATETPLPPPPTIDFSILTPAPTYNPYPAPTYNPYPAPTGQSTAAP
jgi:hypothetical protein